MSDLALTFGISEMNGRIDQSLPLEERLVAAMRYIRKYHCDVLWLSVASGNQLDDLMFRTAIGAVMVEASEDEQDLIRRSLLPLKAIAAATNGIPVDFASTLSDDLISLMKLWKDSDTPPNDKEVQG